MTKSASFRANVGIIVIDTEGRVLAGERTDPPDSWQLPQGGIDLGESAVEALHRELGEETGLTADQVTIVAEHPDWLAYEWPQDRRKDDGQIGQVQKWFVVQLQEGVVPDASKSDDEFQSFKWTTMRELAEDVVEMRRGIYRRLIEDFAAHLA